MTERKGEMTDEKTDEIVGELALAGPEPLTQKQMRQLLADLNPARVATRSQGGASLSYLEAWDVRATMTRIFGFGGWDARILESKVLRIDDVEIGQQKKPGFRVLAYSTVEVRVHQLDAVYSDTGAASQQGPDIGEVMDFALKTSSSDAFKRACMNLGTQFGLSLYDDGSKNDVIKVVLAPGQNEIVAEYRAADAEKERARIEATRPPAPGEDPRD